ncbi:MAG: hypothetical protein GX773_04025, partial [Chloroflexi bacterium]|nr:hypothetical protein [Chloroflexota bacterium]
IDLGNGGDFSTYPLIGYAADRLDVTTIADEWRNFLWTFGNDEGIPLLGMSCTENLTHALYPNYGEIAWDFMKHYARDSASGELLYLQD